MNNLNQLLIYRNEIILNISPYRFRLSLHLTL